MSLHMWSVIYSLNPFSISIAKDTFGHLKTRTPKPSPLQSSLPGSPRKGTAAHLGQPSLLHQHPDTLREVQLSTTRGHPCKHGMSSTRTAFALHSPLLLHTALSYRSSTENAFSYIRRWQLCKAFPWSLWEIRVPHHTAQGQSPFYEKGPWSPVPPSKRSLRSSPKYNHSWDCPQQHVLDKDCFIPSVHISPGVRIPQPGLFEEV